MSTTIAPARRRRLASAINWVIAGKLPSIAARSVVVVGAVWGVLQFGDRFKLVKLPDGFEGAYLFAVTSVAAVLGVELILANVRSWDHEREQRSVVNAADAFAQSIVTYAEALSGGGLHGDRAVVELRGWASRALHLSGANQERQQLGQLALSAASSLGDDLLQADILLDDLGWAVYEAGNSASAIGNIEEAIRIAESTSDAEQATAATLIVIKGMRHLANIRAPLLPLADGRDAFGRIRVEIERLESEASRKFNYAQIDHSEAQLIAERLEMSLGAAAQIEPASTYGQLLEEAVILASGAERAFEDLGDIERLAKALVVKAKLLSHDQRKQKYRETAAKLRRIELEVSRNLKYNQ